jgi:hypothetical protein
VIPEGLESGEQVGSNGKQVGVVMDRDPNGSSQFGRALTYL